MADGGSDWEVVSLTASTYAAAPGPIPISPPLHAADKTESPLLLPNPPAPPAHFFMSQHFNLPLFGTHLENNNNNNNNGSQELESDPAVADGDAADADGLNMPSPENYCEGERDDVLVSPAGKGLQVEGGGGGGEELQRTTMLCSLPDATAGADAAAADATAAGSATLPATAPAATVTAPSGGVEASCNCNAAQAWWEKTFSFPRQDGNGTQPLAFRFVFVAGKLQLQEDHLSPPEFGVHGQTQKISSCAGNEPLGQVKGSMLGGGSPVAQRG